MKIYLSLKWVALVLCMISTDVMAQSSISQDYTGIWMNDRTRTEEEDPFEGMLSICSSGKTSYTVFSNQLEITFIVKQKELANHRAVLEFYFENADVGRGVTNIKFPKKGSLIANAELAKEFELAFKYSNPDFINAVRNSVNVSGTEKKKIFPASFFLNSRKVLPCGTVE